MNRVENSINCFKKGFNCSQAILTTYGKEVGIERETALKIASGFGAGMGRMGNTCGAVTGSFMVIGLKYGRTKVEDKQAKEKTYDLVQKFTNKFKARNGSIMCKELLDCDLSTSEGRQLAITKNLIATRCPKFVQDAAEIIEELNE